MRELKAKSDIVDIISGYIHLQRKGRDFWACCPFHHEENPSFQVRADQQTFKCFGCGKGGNVITFIMEQERLTYPEAIEFLAEKANLEIPKNFVSPDYRKFKEATEKIHNINRETAKAYHRSLYAPENKSALTYLKDRGLSDSTIRTFGLGFSPSSNFLPNFLTKKGYDIDTMKQAGLVRINRHQKPYDIFFERIIFPIIDAQDKVIGFGGRLFNKSEDFAKYVNTSATPAFNKSKSLYSINLLKKLKQSEPVNDIILVEGYMDTIRLYQAGIKNVVAAMGTSLTKRQCDVLSRYTKMVYICFDGDSAGQRMTLRGLDLLQESGIEVKVVPLPEGKDPDDVVLEYGKEKFLELINQALPLIDFKLHNAEQGFDMSTLDGRRKYAMVATKILSSLNAIEREIYAKKVAQKAGISSNTILTQADSKQSRSPKPQATTRTDHQEPSQSPALMMASRFVLASAIELRDYVGQTDIDTAYFENEFHIAVSQYLEECIENKNIPILSDIYDLSNNKEEADKISNILSTVATEHQEMFYKSSLQQLYDSYKKRELKRLAKALIKEKDTTRKSAIENKIKNLSKTQPNI